MGMRRAGAAYVFLLAVVAGAIVAASYVPHRVYRAHHGFADFETMVAALAEADVVFVGEEHGDRSTHRLQLAMLEGLHRRGRRVVLSLEMFERDVQAALDAYLADRISEEAFLAQARPWPHYQTDYRPLVEFARALGWQVVAANVPRSIAASVAKEGLEALDAMPPEERGFVPEDLECSVGAEDPYYLRFAEGMQAHPALDDAERPVAEREGMLERFYYAQCIKDEAMAESIARATGATPGPITVIHVAGAFHSDFGLGAAARTVRRLPDATIRTVSVLPVADLDAIDPTAHAGRADYLVFAWRASNRP
jgi:uncharacterized iron-regulated protein